MKKKLFYFFFILSFAASLILTGNLTPKAQAQANLFYCQVGDDAKGGINTALGCIPVNEPAQFIAWLLQRLIGIGGGIAFLLMVMAGFKIITSTGNPKEIQAGKELLSSAVVGLLFIIFSLVLLKLIGVKILQLPGFGQ